MNKWTKQYRLNGEGVKNAVLNTVKESIEWPRRDNILGSIRWSVSDTIKEALDE